MLTAAAQHAPPVATLMASQWQGANIAWMRTSGVWTAIPTARGGWQGSAAMPVTFALALEVCLHAVVGSPATPLDDAAGQHAVARVGYADDQFLHGDPAALLDVWQPLVDALERHSVQPSKCHVWCPSADDPAWSNPAYDELCMPAAAA